MGIATGHDERPAITAGRAQHAVGKQAVRIESDDDIAWLHVVWRAVVDVEDVARFDRGEHAAAQRANAHVVVPLQQFGDERWARRQEFFLTVRHCPTEGLVLPQASAMVSNSCSRANAGLT